MANSNLDPDPESDPVNLESSHLYLNALLAAAVHKVIIISAGIDATHKRAKAFVIRVTIALPFLAVSWLFSAAAERVAHARLPTIVVSATDERFRAVSILTALI